MQKKWFLLLLAGCFMSLAGGAQQTNPAIERAIKDPKNEENAAKADVRLHSQKIIYDTTSTNAAVTTKKKKKESCRKKGPQ